MALETGTYISDLVATNPPGTDDRSTADDHLRLIKALIKNTLPNLNGAMTSTQAELNTLDGYTGTTADFNILSGASAAGLSATEIRYVNGVTSAIQTQMNGKMIGSNNLSEISTASTARTNLGLGSLAVLSIVKPSSDLSDTITSSGTLSIGAGASWTPPQGVYNMISLNFIGAYFSLNIAGTWRVGLTSISGSAYFDGSLMRVTNNGAAPYTTYWQRFDG